ncbi:uncharacterized protein LOC116033608 [Ipomoea triloba]|uniref:uncharacterized protein LOC116033608 n=1 Tax=Ipomoea triloba TaxID=35885 RepID=UPI00125D93CC|nr:uncharacterized protein LOC116033608 [Ipomoea triloba]
MMITSTKSSASSINGVNAAAVLSSTSPSSSGSELSPRNGGVGKPVRRRSRASKKTPTTHLNADAASFRAVVQQFTGCHTAATFSGAHKGPINLNFGVQEDDDVFDAVSEMRYGGYDSGFRGDRCRKERRWVKKVEEEEEGERNNEVEDRRGLASSTVSSDAALTLDDLDLDNIPFHDFIEDFSLMSEDWNHSSLF